MSTSQTGNERLADSIQSLPGSFDGFRSLSVAEIGPNGPVFAGIGDADPAHSGAPGPDTVFELGSITKTFTGALFADAIERGEVSPDDPLSQYLDALTGTPAGAVTLASLSQHSSGLPGLGETAVASTLESLLLNENPYASTSTEQLIADAAVAPVDPDQGTVYSNFAVALLGTALVEAAGVDDYATLLRERLTEPLGMDHTVVAATADQVPEDAVPGYLLNGTRAPRWWGEGYLPAGSATFTTASDLAIWAQANLDGTAPGAAALQPTAPMGTDTEIGWGWLTSPSFDGTGAQTWHNGATGGFRTFLTLDLAAGTGFLILSNSVAPVEDVVLAYATGSSIPGPDEASVISGWLPFALAVLFGAIALIRAVRARSWLPSASDLAWATFALLVLWISGPWFAVGGWVWGLALAPTLAAAAVLILRAARGPRMPFLPARRAWLWWPLAIAGLAAAAGITVLW
ncbi:serine hydrolase domain-containing protein [Microbacterium sp. 67-17]|uniref:serine hydrolase domain-containing protein n=1 Tax=Microbacterium sp. 67-17 TaxID=1895782 RepID=UPI0025E93049|nr:serine hydrolase domain-containing protein [Microbacterium sp. 67-17]